MTRKREPGAGLLGWSGPLARPLICVVTIVVLVTADPAEPWAWAVLGTGLLCFLAGTFLMDTREVWALGLLAYATLSAAALTGMPGANALVLALVSITDLTVMTFRRTPRLRRNQPIIAVGIGCAIAYALSAQWFDRSQSWYLSQLLWTAVLVLFGLNRRYDELRAQQTAELLDQTMLAQREHARAAALDERSRIARELHDVLAHSLGALSVQLELAEALLAEADDRQAALDRIRRSRRLAVQGLTEARNAVATLRQDNVPALPVALQALTDQHQKDHRTPVRLTVTGDTRQLDSGVVVALLGAARESLTNAARHASGQAVQVELEYSSTGVRLQVRNHLGFAAQPDDAGKLEDGEAGRRGHGGVGMRDHGGAARAGHGEAGSSEDAAPLSPADEGAASAPHSSPADARGAAAGEAGFGLAGMRERLALVGGRVSAGPVGEDWVVLAEVDDE
ncbi:sensor histidine kinase [Kribbella sp. ALI-6-A]|uniref:sensor histidine kinase n=1 Tax=Kribbella sp. ALI-6-A TaxID=1933817 RepID=UPI00117B4F51|nr:histidine kinase [Kribbella sp. ALI-6-A]